MFAHVHFHLVPRPDDPDLRGPRVFGLLGRSEDEDLSPARRDEIALEIRRRL